MIRTGDQIAALLVRMQGAFLDTPALTLTIRDAQLRFGTDGRTCEAVLGALVDASVLTTTSKGEYVRFFPHGDDGSRPSLHAA